MQNEQFKIGILGAGVIADFHALTIQAMSDAQLVCAYARSKEKADALSLIHI